MASKTDPAFTSSNYFSCPLLILWCFVALGGNCKMQPHSSYYNYFFTSRSGLGGDKFGQLARTLKTKAWKNTPSKIISKNVILFKEYIISWGAEKSLAQVAIVNKATFIPPSFFHVFLPFQGVLPPRAVTEKCCLIFFTTIIFFTSNSNLRGEVDKVGWLPRTLKNKMMNNSQNKILSKNLSLFFCSCCKSLL